MIEILTALAMTFFGAPILSVEDPASALSGETLSSRPQVQYAAAGESVAYPLRLVNDGRDRLIVSCELTWDDDEVLTATVFRPAIEADFFAGAPRVRDAYAPLLTSPLPAGETQNLLAVLRVPVPMVAGLRRGEALVTFEDGTTVRTDISLQVFDFELPETPGLSALFTLDGFKMQRTLGLDVAQVESWTPYYDSLSDLGFAYRVAYPIEGEVDTLRDHLRYIAATSPMSIVDVGGAPGALDTYFFQPTAFSPQDPLQTYLHGRLQVVAALGSGRLPVVQPNAFGPRPTWHRIRQSYARFERADDRLVRILAAPAHPHFERYAEIWALPEATAAELLRQLMLGQSIVRYDQGGIRLCVGSAGRLDATGRYQTLASEALDGSEATSWRPAEDSTVPSPWLEITLRDPTRVDTLSILGDLDSAQLPIVESAYNPGDYTSATVKWERASRLTESGLPLFIGTFRHPRACVGLRLRFESGKSTTPIAVHEVLINNERLETVEEGIDPVVPWLDGSDSNYSAWTLGPNGNMDNARSLPWRCWALGFRGVLGPVLNGDEAGVEPLVGLGKGQFLPSRRLFSFRDGLEDYEYLRAYWGQAGDSGTTSPTGFAPGMGAESFDSSEGADARRDQIRVKTGRILSGESIVTKNFGPRKSPL